MKQRSKDLRAAATVVDQQLAPEPRSAIQARHALDKLAGEVTEPLLADLRLLVTELVSNVVKHGHMPGESTFHFCVSMDRNKVHVEVAQEGPSFEAPRFEDRDLRESGWGLHLVDVLADEWGVRSDPTTVWFDVSRRAATA